MKLTIFFSRTECLGDKVIRLSRNIPIWFYNRFASVKVPYYDFSHVGVKFRSKDVFKGKGVPRYLYFHASEKVSQIDTIEDLEKKTHKILHEFTYSREYPVEKFKKILFSMSGAPYGNSQIRKLALQFITAEVYKAKRKSFDEPICSELVLGFLKVIHRNIFKNIKNIRRPIHIFMFVKKSHLWRRK